MKIPSVLLSAYYLLRPLISRNTQIALRRRIASATFDRESYWWPVPDVQRRSSGAGSVWPDDAQFALAIRHDVETTEGVSQVERLVQIDLDHGVRSSFNFCPERYRVPDELRARLTHEGFELGLHGLRHDGLLYLSRRTFLRRASRMVRYIREWGVRGFYSPSSHHRLDWLHELPIEYDSSTFDVDPFEPENDGIGFTFPFQVHDPETGNSYVELPYTLPQDFTLFVLLEQHSIDLWKRKLDYIASVGGLAFVVVHPDYIEFSAGSGPRYSYPVARYEELLDYVTARYGDTVWHALPGEIAEYWRTKNAPPADEQTTDA